MPWGPFSVILEHLDTERTDFSYSANICLHSFSFSVASGKVLGGDYAQRKHREACQRTLNLAVSERGVIIFNEFDGALQIYISESNTSTNWLLELAFQDGNILTSFNFGSSKYLNSSLLVNFEEACFSLIC